MQILSHCEVGYCKRPTTWNGIKVW